MANDNYTGRHLQFSVTIGLGNDAMQTANDVARELRRIAAKLTAESGQYRLWTSHGGPILDSNGNTVGEFGVSWIKDY